MKYLVRYPFSFQSSLDRIIYDHLMKKFDFCDSKCDFKKILNPLCMSFAICNNNNSLMLVFSKLRLFRHEWKLDLYS